MAVSGTSVPSVSAQSGPSNGELASWSYSLTNQIAAPANVVPRSSREARRSTASRANRALRAITLGHVTTVLHDRTHGRQPRPSLSEARDCAEFATTKFHVATARKLATAQNLHAPNSTSHGRHPLQEPHGSPRPFQLYVVNSTPTVVR